MIRVILLAALAGVFAYLGQSFYSWELSPQLWMGDERGSFLVAWFGLALLAGTVNLMMMSEREEPTETLTPRIQSRTDGKSFSEWREEQEAKSEPKLPPYLQAEWEAAVRGFSQAPPRPSPKPQTSNKETSQ